MALESTSGNYVRPGSSSPFLRQLAHELASYIGEEIDLTMRVGVLAAAGMNRTEIKRTIQFDSPQISDTEIRMAFERLRKVATAMAPQ
jgi:hypothetical protein